jgi:hypothetical protein
MRPHICLVMLLVLLAWVCSMPASARDRNDNDRQREQRNEREELLRLILVRQLMHQQYLGQQLATYQYLEYLRQRAALGSITPSGWWPSRPATAEYRATIVFREAPGERELESAYMCLKSDPSAARDWLLKAIDKAGADSEVADLARRQLRTLEEKP